MNRFNVPEDCHTKLIPLRWSSFPITHTWKDLVLTFELTVSTRSLSLNYISEERESRFELIESLFGQGYSDKQISKILNEKNILTPRGKQYYYELVYVTRKKLQKRKIREIEKSISLSNFRLNLIIS